METLVPVLAALASAAGSSLVTLLVTLGIQHRLDRRKQTWATRGALYRDLVARLGVADREIIRAEVIASSRWDDEDEEEVDIIRVGEVDEWKMRLSLEASADVMVLAERCFDLLWDIKHVHATPEIVGNQSFQDWLTCRRFDPHLQGDGQPNVLAVRADLHLAYTLCMGWVIEQVRREVHGERAKRQSFSLAAANRRLDRRLKDYLDVEIGDLEFLTRKE